MGTSPESHNMDRHLIDRHLLKRTNYLLTYIAFVLSVAALVQALDAAGVI